MEERVPARMAPDGLSPRELQVARLVAGGRSAKEVARLLGIAPATARNHLQRVHARLGSHSASELAVRLAGAERHGDVFTS